MDKGTESRGFEVPTREGERHPPRCRADGRARQRGGPEPTGECPGQRLRTSCQPENPWLLLLPTSPHGRRTPRSNNSTSSPFSHPALLVWDAAPPRPKASDATRVSGDPCVALRGRAASGGQADRESFQTGALTASVFDAYRPSVRTPGACPHPTRLVESAAMAAATAPNSDYRPTLPEHLVTEGSSRTRSVWPTATRRAATAVADSASSRPDE